MASEKLDVAAGVSRWQKPIWTATNVPNKEKELKKCLAKAKKQAEAAGHPLRLACESTGVYHRVLERCAAEAGVPLCVLPPNRVCGFAKGEREQEKTDPGDAALIMRYAMVYSPRITPYDPERYRLQEMVGLRVQLAEDLGQYKTRLQTAKCEQAAAFTRRQIAFIEAQIKELEREIEAFLALRATDVVVPLHTLEASMPRSVEAPKTIETSSFSLTAFIARHFPNAKPMPYNGGTKWVLDVCPFNPDHNDRSAVITQTSEGRIGFVCHHNGCSGKTWHDLRTLLEPPTSLPDVSIDTTAILQRKAPTPPPPPRVVPQKEWEKVTLETLEREVLPGTILERITRLLSQVTTPHLPLAFTLPKALVLIGAALSERTDEEGPASRQGVELARLALNSAGGQVCNMYCLLAAPSGTGKDIGGLEEKMARRNNWFVGSAGSKEGLYDAYMVKPNGILKISELQPYLEPRHWQHEAAQFFTEAFNQGAFNHCQSMRVKNAVPRQSNYCYPNVLANIQPDVFERIARPIDIESGLLGRFLVSHAPHFCGDPGRFNLKETLSTLQSYLDLFTRKCGLLDLPDHYASDLKASLMEDAPSMMFSHIARLCNEYYPRLATVLSVTESAITQGPEVLLSPDVWHRAKLLIHWFYHNAYRLFGRITDDDDRSHRREIVLLRVLRRARKVDCPHGFTRRDISLGGLKGTDAKERKEALDEMLDRGWLTLEGLSYHLTDLAPELDC